MSPETLTANQLRVLSLISSGSTALAAAKETGIHRNTIGSWLRLPAFRQALAHSNYDRAVRWHEAAASLAVESVRAIAQIITDVHAPAAVRLRAALAMIDKAVSSARSARGMARQPAPRRSRA